MPAMPAMPAMKMPRDPGGDRSRRAGLAVVAAAGCLAAAGCMGSWAIHGTRLHYNESFSHTSSQEMLLNIVRMRYGETPTFLDLPTINNVTEAKVLGNGAQPEDSPLQGIFGGDFFLRDEPTLGYQPRRGNSLAESLVKPMKAEIMLDVPPGNDTRTFLLAMVDSINGVRNSPTATSVKLRVAKREDETHGPVPDATVLATDAVTAAKEGYVYRSTNEQVSLLRRERLLAMTIRPEELGVADLAELTEICQLVPGRTAYAIKSQEDVEIDLNDEAAAALPPAGPHEELSLNVRSGYQALAFLAKGVTVPAAHVRRGEVPMFTGLDGRPFDARRLTRGLFHVCVQKHKPLRSDLAVHYRGHWFYIAEEDVQSRASLSFVKFIIDLNSQAGSAGPILTLPLR